MGPRQIQIYLRPNPGRAGRHHNTLIETPRLQVLSAPEALGLGFFSSPLSSLLKWCCLFWEARADFKRVFVR